MGLLENKVALVTGASRGIGRAIATRFAQEGAQVAFTYLSSVEKGQALEAELAALGIKAKGYRSDASDYQQAEDLMNQVVADFGKIDVLVNNAGITKDATLLKMTDEQWDQVIAVNLTSIFKLSKAAAEVMKAAGKGGSIIHAASVVAHYGNFGQTNYSATKAGVIAMAKTMAKELGKDKIRVNAVAPGFIATPMVKKMPEKVLAMMEEKASLRRLGEPSDIAAAYAFLASDDASYITGTCLNVDGGTILG